MPGLVLFKRRWTAGSDDLVLPGIFLSLLHFTLFVVTAAYLSFYSDLDKWSSLDPDDIKNRNANESTIIYVRCAKSVQAYSFVFVALLVAATVLEGIMVAFSMQGTIFNPKPRQPVKYVIYARSVLGITEVLFSIAVASYLSSNWDRCQKLYHLFLVQAVIVGFNFATLLVMMLVMCCVYDSTGYSFYKMKRATERPSLSTTHMDALRTEFEATLQQSWHASLRRCCCCMRDTQNTQVALDEVSHLLRDFFRDLDVVPSDLLSGLILLRHKQQCMESNKVLSASEVEEFLCGRPISNHTVYYDPTNTSNRQSYENLIYFCNYAIASYGPLFYLVYNPGTGICKLFNQCLCGNCDKTEEERRFSAPTVESDGCCDWETSAVLRSLKGNVDNSDMVFASWDNDLYKQPFFVCVDHDKKAVVVTIRGTLSELDALTDIVATPTGISCEGVDGSWKCHKGIMKAAMYLKEKLTNEMILSQAFGRDLSRGTRDYQLVLVGHSLGAGVASILAIMLRPIYPDLMCYSYSPPGGLLSLSAMEGSKDYITTAVYGKDLVIRMGLPQLGKMKKDIVDLLQRTKLPKYRIIFGNLFTSTENRHCLVADEPQSGSDVEQSLINNFGGRCGDVIEHEPLYPPGRILHVIYKKPSDRGCCFNKSSEKTLYFAVEADNKNDFNEILVSHNMVRHHWPQELQKAMKKVLLTPLTPELERKYSKSATIPSHARLSKHEDERTELLATKQDDQQPDVIETSLPHHDVQQGTEANHTHDDVGDSRTSSAHVGSYSKTSPAHNSVAPLSPSSAQAMDFVQAGNTFAEVNELSPLVNKNNNNSKSELGCSKSEKDSQDKNSPDVNSNHESHTSADDKEEAHEGDGGVPGPTLSPAPPTNEGNQSESLVNRFGDYLDTVLQEPCDDCGGTNQLLPVPSSRYARSQSMPSRNSISSPRDLDKEVLKRARFEPNLIPKPPRSNSTSSKRRPVNLPVRKPRDYASAPPSRTITPTATHNPPPPIVG